MMQTSKAIIFDSGTLISFSMNGLLEIIRDLKKIFTGKFLITQDVKKELVDKPIKIKRFELEALKLKQLIDEGILSFSSSLGIKDNDITVKTNEILKHVNEIFKTNKGPVKIIDRGEASCIALSKILSEKNIKHILAVDERTTRMLVENPESTKSYLEKKLHTKINVDKKSLKYFKGIKVIRSPELVYVAWKKGLIKMKSLQALDALLYAVKFKGASISGDEIEQIKKLG